MTTGRRLRFGVLLLLVVGLMTVPQAGHTAPTFTYVTMSDGVQLAVGVNYPPGFSPDDEGEWGTVFQMDGYAGGGTTINPANFNNNYVTVYASVRGTGCSGGRFDLFDRRHAYDGYEIIENWIVKQPWSNGKVAIDGYSYPALTGWMVASTNPPHLEVITLGGLIDDLYRGIVFPGGVGNYGFPAVWTGAYRPASEYSGNAGRYQNETTSGDARCAANIATRPPRDAAEDPIIRGATQLQDGPWWQFRSTITWIRGITKPIHLTQHYQDEQTGPRGGWHLWEEVLPDVPKRLVATNGRHGRSPQESADRRAWIDCWMLHAGDEDACDEIRPGLRDESRRVQIYFETQGGNQPAALESSDFPLPETDWTRYFLRGNGTATTDAPGASEAGRMFVSAGRGRQPSVVNEVTSSGGPDELGYTVSFDGPAAIAGPIQAKLWTTSTAPDTDLMVTLIDVWPTGQYEYLQRGLLRATHREIDQLRSDRIASGPYAGEIYRPHRPHVDRDLLTPGTPTELLVEVFPVGHVFREGHKLLIKISAPGLSDPVSDIYAYPGDQVAAVNTILNDAAHPSSLLLPMLPALPPIAAAAPACGAQSGVRCTTPAAP